MQKLKFEICQRLKADQAFTQFVQQLPQRFAQEGETVYDKRNVIKVFDLSGTKLVVKRFKRLSFFQGVIYTFFRASKANRAFRNARLLQERGIATPEGLAFAEEKRGHLLCYGYFVSAADFTAPVSQKLYLPAGGVNPAVAGLLGLFFARLHKQGILHHDLNGTNILYNEQTQRFSLIDINRMDFYTPGAEIPAVKRYENLSRYCANMLLHRAVAESYAAEMGGDARQTVADMMEVKRRHDQSYARTKSFTRKFKKLFHL